MRATVLGELEHAITGAEATQGSHRSSGTPGRSVAWLSSTENPGSWMCQLRTEA